VTSWWTDPASWIILAGSLALALWVMSLVNWLMARHDRSVPDDDDPYDTWRGDDLPPWDRDR
jgi:hypothetical protein